jgi:hypothetical protein
LLSLNLGTSACCAARPDPKLAPSIALVGVEITRR